MPLDADPVWTPFAPDPSAWGNIPAMTALPLRSDESRETDTKSG